MINKVFETADEMDEWIDNNEYEISAQIVDTICENWPIEDNLLCLSWHCKEENTDYDVECDPQYVKETLETNLIIMLQYEDYERCAKIKEILY